MNEENQEQPGDKGDRSVDEDWKEKVREEKERLKEEQETGEGPGRGGGPGGSPAGGGGAPGGARQQLPEASFSSIIGGIGIQAAMALGQVEHPETGEKMKDLDQAEHFIESLKILREKTEGNLNQQEENHLETLISELKMEYVREAKKQGKSPEDDSDAEQPDAGTDEGRQERSGNQQDEGGNIYTP